MPKFLYKAKDKKNQTLKGLVEAKDEKQAVKILREKGLLVFSLKTSRKSLSAQIGGSLFNRVSGNDKVNFTRQLATMFTAGLPITDALSILEAQSQPAMGQIVSEVLREVEGGGSLAKAMKKHPEVFDEIYVAMVKAGEAAGVLDKILNRLADNLEKDKEFRSKIKGAMIYPVIVVAGMVAVTMIMILFVIPKMMVIYESFEVELPVTTRFLVAVSHFTTKFWWLGSILLVLLALGWRAATKLPLVKEWLDRLIFKVPIMGKLKRQLMLTEFTRTLGLLAGVGILLVDALEIVQHSMGSPLYKKAVEESGKDVQKGLPLASALAKTGIFPPIVPQMIAVGEETGKVDEVLLKVSSYFEQEANTLVKGLTTAIEPIIMIFLGVGVAFLMISIIMPIYNLTSQF